MPAEIVAFVKGIAVGAAVAVPVGPMSLLCMRRTLAQGWRPGFATGTGIATADAFYALVAALGLASVMHFMAAYERPLHLAAGVCLIYLGWRTFFVRTSQNADAPQAASTITAAFSSALLLTLTNPPTIISFAAIFAVVVPTDFDAVGALSTTCGVFTGSLLWWLCITSIVAAVRRALGPRVRLWIERVCGAVLGALGIAELRRAL